MKINKVYTKSIERIMSSLSLDFIHNGITLPEILKILKKSMVLTAEKINKSNVKLTESRISLLTGVLTKLLLLMFLTRPCLSRLIGMTYIERLLKQRSVPRGGCVTQVNQG